MQDVTCHRESDGMFFYSLPFVRGGPGWGRFPILPPPAPPYKGGGIAIDIIGDGFLKQMVRNIVGTLVEVGEGRRRPGDIRNILASRDRKTAGRCAPPYGLYLVEVGYRKLGWGG